MVLALNLKTVFSYNARQKKRKEIALDAEGSMSGKDSEFSDERASFSASDMDREYDVVPELLAFRPEGGKQFVPIVGRDGGGSVASTGESPERHITKSPLASSYRAAQILVSMVLFSSAHSYSSAESSMVPVSTGMEI